MPEVEEFQCGNTECRVAETGKCIEGLALDQCPNLNRPAVSTELTAATVDNDIKAAKDSEGSLELPSGERLSITEASGVLRAGESRVVAIIGPTAAGKTSLIASLYDLFQMGPIGKLLFARSRTLYAFEQACHHARAVSRRPTPHMERTPLGNVEFYHLGLRNEATSAILDLLLADRAGEDYRSAADDPSAAARFVEVQRADAISVLVDGERLLDLAARHNVRSETEMILQGLVDGNIVCAEQRIALVLTKLDEVERSPQKERAERDFNVMIQKARRLFGHVFGEIVSFRVAASPVTDVLPRGHGVPELLQFWVSVPAVVSRTLLPLPRSVRAMGRLTAIAE